MGRTYVTRGEAIAREIVEPIEASGVVVDARREFDVDAIADEVIVFSRRVQKFFCQVGPDEFWAEVERNAVAS